MEEKIHIQFGHAVGNEVTESYKGVVDVRLYEIGTKESVRLRMYKDDLQSLYESLRVFFGAVHPECVGVVE